MIPAIRVRPVRRAYEELRAREELQGLKDRRAYREPKPQG
jgi:hypothetical protein